jgi:hypothetical protein
MEVMAIAKCYFNLEPRGSGIQKAARLVALIQDHEVPCLSGIAISTIGVLGILYRSRVALNLGDDKVSFSQLVLRFEITTWSILM